MSGSSKPLRQFLESLSQADRARWDSLTPARRRDAEARFDLFEQWADENISAEEAIRRFGKSSSRFYRLAAQWRERPSLEALGVGVRAPRSRAKLDPEVVNALQAKVAEIVRLNADFSVSRQAGLLLEAAGYTGKKPVGITTLRQIVETERRRVEATGSIGHQICLDCSAINLPRPDKRPYILFVIIDAGTGLALGYSVGGAADVVLGYSDAAIDALNWIDQNGSELPWSARLSQTILVSGEDDDASKALVEWMVAEGIGGNVLRANRPRRFGSQFRRLYGERLGRIQITPARTLEGEALPDNGNMTPWPETEVREELRRTFAEHNASIRVDLKRSANSSPPASLIDFLQKLAAVGPSGQFEM